MIKPLVYCCRLTRCSSLYAGTELKLFFSYSQSKSCASSPIFELPRRETNLPDEMIVFLACLIFERCAFIFNYSSNLFIFSIAIYMHPYSFYISHRILYTSHLLYHSISNASSRPVPLRYMHIYSLSFVSIYTFCLITCCILLYWELLFYSISHIQPLFYIEKNILMNSNQRRLLVLGIIISLICTTLSETRKKNTGNDRRGPKLSRSNSIEKIKGKFQRLFSVQDNKKGKDHSKSKDEQRFVSHRGESRPGFFRSMSQERGRPRNRLPSDEDYMVAKKPDFRRLSRSGSFESLFSSTRKSGDKKESKHQQKPSSHQHKHQRHKQQKPPKHCTVMNSSSDCRMVKLQFHGLSKDVVQRILASYDAKANQFRDHKGDKDKYLLQLQAAKTKSRQQYQRLQQRNEKQEAQLLLQAIRKSQEQMKRIQQSNRQQKCYLLSLLQQSCKETSHQQIMTERQRIDLKEALQQSLKTSKSKHLTQEQEQRMKLLFSCFTSGNEEQDFLIALERSTWFTSRGPFERESNSQQQDPKDSHHYQVPRKISPPVAQKPSKQTVKKVLQQHKRQDNKGPRTYSYVSAQQRQLLTGLHKEVAQSKIFRRNSLAFND